MSHSSKQLCFHDLSLFGTLCALQWFCQHQHGMRFLGILFPPLSSSLRKPLLIRVGVLSWEARGLLGLNSFLQTQHSSWCCVKIMYHYLAYFEDNIFKTVVTHPLKCYRRAGDWLTQRCLPEFRPSVPCDGKKGPTPTRDSLTCTCVLWHMCTGVYTHTRSHTTNVYLPWQLKELKKVP